MRLFDNRRCPNPLGIPNLFELIFLSQQLSWPGRTWPPKQWGGTNDLIAGLTGSDEHAYTAVRYSSFQQGFAATQIKGLEEGQLDEVSHHDIEGTDHSCF